MSIVMILFRYIMANRLSEAVESIDPDSEWLHLGTGKQRFLKDTRKIVHILVATDIAIVVALTQ